MPAMSRWEAGAGAIQGAAGGPLPVPWAGGPLKEKDNDRALDDTRHPFYSPINPPNYGDCDPLGIPHRGEEG